MCDDYDYGFWSVLYFVYQIRILMICVGQSPDLHKHNGVECGLLDEISCTSVDKVVLEYEGMDVTPKIVFQICRSGNLNFWKLGEFSDRLVDTSMSSIIFKMTRFDSLTPPSCVFMRNSKEEAYSFRLPCLSIYQTSPCNTHHVLLTPATPLLNPFQLVWVSFGLTICDFFIQFRWKPCFSNLLQLIFFFNLLHIC